MACITSSMLRCLLLLVVVSGLAACDCIGDHGGTAVLFIDNRASVALRLVAEQPARRADADDDVITLDVAPGERLQLAEGSGTGDNPAPLAVLNELHLFVADSDEEIAGFDGLDTAAWTKGSLDAYEGTCATRYGVREWDLVIEDEDLASE
jgi:hypothetical protein